MKKLILTLLAVVSLLAGASTIAGSQAVPVQAAQTPSYGADANPTGNPIGGGVGYSHIISSSAANYIVSTKSQLLSALSSATSGQIIYVADTAEIDLSGSKDIIVPAGITLASGRGRNGSLGGLIYTNTMTYSYATFIRAEDHVTFSGLRVRGPDGTVGTSGAVPTVWGIRCSGGHHGLVVENCEIYNWTFAAVAVYTDGLTDPQSLDRGWVHHNYIHHNQRLGYGYGVDVGQASALIEANIFDYGRHFIAGGRGTPVTNYEVRYNIFKANCTHTLVDCHGGNDLPADGFAAGPDASVWAGGTLLVHHNTFQSSSQPSVKPRGVPQTICECYNNWTYHSGSTPTSGAFRQETDHLGLTGYQNMSVHDNWYGTTAPPSTNHAPVLDAIGKKTVNEETALAFTISGSDADGDTLTYSASNLPLGASFDSATRTFAWTPGSGQSGAYANVHFQVSDGKVTDSEDITITVAVNSTLEADVNGDGAVNSLDMIRIGQHWGETGAGGWIREDINQDGIVSVLDATLVGQHWTG
jgi:hypothetical protein